MGIVGPQRVSHMTKNRVGRNRDTLGFRNVNPAEGATLSKSVGGVWKAEGFHIIDYVY